MKNTDQKAPICRSDELSPRTQRITFGKMVSFPMERGQIDQGMQFLKESKAKYIFAVVLEGDWQAVVQSAYNHQVMGNPEHVWLVPDLTYLLSPSFGLDRQTEGDLGLAMHGMGMINLQMQSHHQHVFFGCRNPSFTTLFWRLIESQIIGTGTTCSKP